ncbi:TonB-dependent receptor plug domain-containing protein, partial [Escherichia coli]|nr:TonB-dependent receptor plug domain-containing protein [Escherichia coli]
PGVNLTGTSTSGQRGNNRQTDIRRMRPGATLRLIDGKRVSISKSVRHGWRDGPGTRGGTDWRRPELIERVVGVRGPSPARCA